MFGWIFAGPQIGAAAAAYGAGLTRTLAGSYLPAFFTSGVLCLLAALMIIAQRGRTIEAKAAQAPSVTKVCSSSASP